MRRFFYSHGNTSSDPSLSIELKAHSIGSDIELPESIVHHWCRVLRASVGDQGILFDGFGGEYQVQLKSISKKSATATLLSQMTEDRTAPIFCKIGLVMSRGERMDYAIQKATELGVTAIQLLSSHHGEVSLKPAQVDKKLAHWQQIAIAACEQCGLNRPPLILSPLSINDWLKSLDYDTSNASDRAFTVSPIVSLLSQDTYYQALLQPADLCMQMSVPAAGQPAMPDNLLQILKQETPYIKLLIGPEGGLSLDERQQASSVGFNAWQIGSRVLRTETAPVVALSTLHALSI